ncbi:MAG: class I SAM-dependent methyltransferase [Planctomycetes bacterium]|nr:class I SAM-dependent methyltransferase [Planctomycetota bacterium]
MSPEVFARFEEIVTRRLPGTARRTALEVGAGGWTLLSIPTFAHGPRIALNLRFDRPTEQLRATRRVVANGNHLPFADATFDCVLSCSALEHDRWFWRSTAEVLRVLRPGGYFVVGVPIYMTLPGDKDFTTVTYARHGLAYNADYYRFSEQAVREVFFEGYAEVTDELIVRKQPNPYLVAAGRK